MSVPRDLFQGAPPETLIQCFLAMCEEIQPGHALTMSLVLHHATKSRGNSATTMGRQHKHAAEPWAEILATFEIELSKCRSPQCRVAVMSDPGDRQFVAVQMRSEFCSAFSRSLIGENVRPVLEQAGDQLLGKLRVFCQVADAHEA